MLLDERSINNSTVFTTQLPLAHWTEVIGDPVIADAIRDRLEHAAHTINITGESYRSVKARKVAAKEKDASMSTSTAPPETRARRVLNSEIGWVQSWKLRTTCIEQCDRLYFQRNLFEAHFSTSHLRVARRIG